MVYQEQQIDALRRKKNKKSTRKQGQGRNNSRRSNTNSSFNNTNRSSPSSKPNNKKKENDFPTTTTVPSLWQYTNGVSVTRINMVTTLDPVIKRSMKPILLTCLVQTLGASQEQITNHEINRQHKSISIRISTSGLCLIAPTATSPCRAIRSISMQKQIAINKWKDEETIIMWVTVQVQLMVIIKITYLKEHWLFGCSMVSQCPYPDFVFLTQWNQSGQNHPRDLFFKKIFWCL